MESRISHGAKRKLSDGDCELRCHQRQTVFNISICKLQRSSSYSEPVLCRTVLIANTVKLIEREIEEERRFCGVSEFGSVSNVSKTEIAPERTSSTSIVDLDSLSHQSNCPSSKFVDFERELNILGEKITDRLDLESRKPGENKQRPSYDVESCNNRCNVTSTKNTDSTYRQDFERDLIAASNLLGLELHEEIVFSDVDVSLYDFDIGTSILPVEIEELCANAMNICNTVSRCGESLKFEKASEHLFDDLDQVMQVLVGS